MIQHLRPAIVMTVLFTLLLGLAYPLTITGIASLAFPNQASGSLLHDASGKVVIGSSLIAQGFSQPQYLHPRASAAGNGYDPMSSGGTNLGPLDQKLINRVKADASTLAREAPGVIIPADAVTTSASGLDPDISPENARMQAPRIGASRGIEVSVVNKIIDANIEGPALGFIGQRRVNVLAVNRALDARYPVVQPKS